MTVSTVAVADASPGDKYLHTNQRTISSTAREDQYVLPGQNAYPTYAALTAAVSGATAASHLLQIMGDGSGYSRLVRLRIHPLQATSAGAQIISVYRLSSAGTGGTSVTPAPFDTSDTYGGGAMTLPSSKGTEGTELLRLMIYYPAAGGIIHPIEWQALPGSKPIIFGSATSNGLALKVEGGLAGSSIDITAEFLVTSYL